MKRALIVTDLRGGRTATQDISFAQPFERANAGSYEIAFATDDEGSGAIGRAFDVDPPDLIVLSRYTAANGVEWIDRAHAAGIPAIFHIDDDLLAVPMSLGPSKYKTYNDPARLAALRANIERSDLCYVSTAELGKRFLAHGIETPILAGEIYCSITPEEVGALVPPATGPVIGYMGTGGHSADLAVILPAIAELMDLVPELNFEMFGTIKMPSELAAFGPRVRHLPPVGDYSAFRRHLRSLGWWVGLAPLEDNAFNRCKADTKWVEYSLAGMAVVASDLPVYRRACADGCGILATTADEWVRGVADLLYTPDRRQLMIDAAKAKLLDLYSCGKLRAQVLRVFEEAFRSRSRLPGPRS
jgi:glycosyltransferase involved in cell wall biosynthesis